MSEDRHLPVLRPIVVRDERPPGDRPHAQDVEEVRGDPQPRDPLGFPRAGQVAAPGAVRGDPFERAVAVAIVQEVRQIQRVLAVVRAPQRDGDQPIGFAERQRAQEHRVDDAEDRGDGAGAERQGEDGDGREAALRSQQPQAIRQVLSEIAEQAPHRQRLERRGGSRAAPRPGGNPRIAALELGPRPALRLPARDPLRAEPRLDVLEVLRQLFDDRFPTPAVIAFRRGEPPPDLLPPVGHAEPSPGSGRVTRAIAATKDSQVLRCAARTFLPSRVSR